MKLTEFCESIIELKLNLQKKVLFSRTDFLPWELLVIKKSEFEKTKPTCNTTFKTDVIKVVFVFSISNFFINKNSQGRKFVHEKNYLILQIRLNWKKIRKIRMILDIENSLWKSNADTFWQPVCGWIQKIFFF